MTTFSDLFSRGDFDLAASLNSDILLENIGGQKAIWLLTDGVRTSQFDLPSIGASWHSAGVIDFGSPGGGFDNGGDILWRNDTGAAAIWFMSPSTGAKIGEINLPNNGPTWKVAGVNDFGNPAGGTFDNIGDILWRNDNGATAIWFGDGNGKYTVQKDLQNNGPTWKVASTGDFNGDAVSDILWRNDNGAAAIWYMNPNGTKLAEANLPNNGASWKVAGTGDLNNDTFQDIVWRNDNGAVAVWLGDGGVTGKFTVQANLQNNGATWHIVGVRDFNFAGHPGDFKADILWQNDNGAGAIWFMDGVTKTADVNLPNPGPTWIMT
jgi:hypothetical protein